jgi:prepilin-type processing-associated H-X9-DG protein
VRILPYAEQSTVYNQIDFKVKYLSHANNALVRATQLGVFLCPSDSYNQTPLEIVSGGVSQIWARGNYAANAGNGPLLNWGTRTDRIDGPDSPGWQDPKRRGAIGPNVSVRLKEITDGTSNSMLLGEVRAGITAFDRRGTWALGQAGGSMLIWFGTTGDANGPNLCFENADDVAGVRQADIPLMVQECMQEYYQDELNAQATTRSMHQGGVNLGMADGSAHFVSNSVEVGPPNVRSTWPDALPMTVWDKLIATADDQIIGAMPF